MNKIAVDLEKMALKGRILKKVELNLKGGLGVCTVYTDLVKHPDQRVTVAGKIVMGEGASIGLHGHDKDSETYTVLSGTVMSNGVVYGPGNTMVCNKGEAHDCINLAGGESVLRFVKRE